jgi:hypothetical protein
VIDHCTLTVNSNGTAQGFSILGDGVPSWARPSSFGTKENVFIENCQFNFVYKNDAAIDLYNGSRVVIRNCQFNGTSLTWHGFDSGNYESPFSTEVYKCKFTENGNGVYTAMRSRGGTAIFFNDTVDAGYDNFVILSNFRSCPGHIGYHDGANGSTTLQDADALFVSGSPASTYVYKVATNEVDTVKTRTETTITSDIVWNTGDRYASVNYLMVCGMCLGYSTCDGNATVADSGYACKQQIGRGTDGALDPVYAWNNVYGADETPTLRNDYDCERNALHIKKDREYYENTERPGYVPYDYPHPLTLLGEPPVIYYGTCGVRR